MNKTKRAARRLLRGDFTLPSPAEVAASKHTAKQLAEWGLAYPPSKGWRGDLRRRWLAANPGQQSEQARIGGLGQIARCEVCKKPTDAVVVTDGVKPDGTLNVRCFCGHEHASQAGFHYFGLPSGSVSNEEPPF